MTLMSAAAIVLLPGLAASWWTVRRVALTGGSGDSGPDLGQQVGLVYSGVGVELASWTVLKGIGEQFRPS